MKLSWEWIPQRVQWEVHEGMVRRRDIRPQPITGVGVFKQRKWMLSTWKSAEQHSLSPSLLADYCHHCWLTIPSLLADYPHHCWLTIPSLLADYPYHCWLTIPITVGWLSPSLLVDYPITVGWLSHHCWLIVTIALGFLPEPDSKTLELKTPCICL